MCCTDAVGKDAEPPKWIKPQLTRVADEAPAGDDWLHEIKYDGYRMHARLDRRKVQLLTRTGLDWSRRYPRTIEALRFLAVKTAYLDGELCALRPDGVPAFSRLQAAMDEGRTDDLMFIVFDLLYLDSKSLVALPLIKRKERLQMLFRRPIGGLRYSDHVVGNGPRLHQEACRLGAVRSMAWRVRILVRSITASRSARGSAASFCQRDDCVLVTPRSERVGAEFFSRGGVVLPRDFFCFAAGSTLSPLCRSPRIFISVSSSPALISARRRISVACSIRLWSLACLA